MNYSGFWKRFAALFIDTIALGVCGFIVGIVFAVIYVSLNGSEHGTEIWANALGIIMAWIYFAGFESSPKQATLGKMALGIKVVGLDGERLSFGKASGRYFGKIISSLILGIGYIMVAFTEKKQGLHDKMAGCLVIDVE